MSEEINASAGLVLRRGETPPPDFQDRYWDTVARTFRYVFGETASERVDALRRKVENATPDTQTVFYHAEPFDVAGDLAGRRGELATVEEKRRYVDDILQRAPENAPSHEDLG